MCVRVLLGALTPLFYFIDLNSKPSVKSTQVFLETRSIDKGRRPWVSGSVSLGLVLLLVPEPPEIHEAAWPGATL